MTETVSLATRLAPSANGHSRRPGKPLLARHPGKPRRLSRAQRLAIGTGAFGAGILALSVAHCTESIALLTGSHWALAALLAIGIDAGVVGCELAELVAHGTKAARNVKPWARAYIGAAVLLSCLLNAYAFGLHAPTGMVWASWALGLFVPALVYTLGRVAGHLWLGE